MRILFITPYPSGEAPSQRFRFEQYFRDLIQEGHQYKVSAFLDLQAWNIIYKKGHFPKKVFALFRGYLKRLYDLFRVLRYDIVFIHREASPFGFPVFVFIITRIFKKYTVFDFDDAIWIPNASETNRNLTMKFKRFKNVNDTCKWATVISVGNQYLAAFACQYNKNVIINPTTIDTDEHHNSTTDHSNSKFIIGWTGSHSTVHYLDDVYPVLKRLEDEFDFEFHVICDIPPRFSLRSLKFIPWSKQAEIDDLLNFNVGIMPLPDDVWAKGKCGFKALQYMALGVPAVVSGVGVNAEIVDHNINGCVCNTQEEWYASLRKLLSEPAYLRKLSEKTREKIVNHYSVKSNRENFLSLLSVNKNS
jgi:glycosyltransferase involved in cell wall biosynthesis